MLKKGWEPTPDVPSPDIPRWQPQEESWGDSSGFHVGSYAVAWLYDRPRKVKKNPIGFSS